MPLPILLISPTNVYATKRLQQEARLANVNLQSFDVADLAKVNFDIKVDNFSLLYVRQAYPKFTEVINLAKKFEANGLPVVDANIAEGDLGLGKFVSLEKLHQAGIPIPFSSILRSIEEKGFSYPFIAKWNYGFGGKHNYLVKSPADLDPLTKKYPPEQLLLQEFIPAEFEYKIITVGFKALPAVLKFKTKQAGFTPDFDDYEIVAADQISEIVNFAGQAAKVLQRELAKVDILEAAGKLYVLEVNRWPGFQNFEKLSGYNVARAFIKHLENKNSLGL